MAKFPRRQDPLKQDEMLTLAQRALDFLQLYRNWLIVGLAGLALLVAGTAIAKYWQQSRRDAAVAALAEVRPKLERPEEAEAALPSLERLVREYGSTPAAREAALQRAHLLYQLEKYEEAAAAYKGLLRDPAIQRDAPLRLLITESLSYCYEGLGKYGEAADVLKPLAEQSPTVLQGELTRRLAWLYEQAGRRQEAQKYWQMLLENPPNPAIVPYLKEKLAAAPPEPEK
jgi:tetratricopeptide (TPR) repeat protein